MLRLSKIVKDYEVANTYVRALKGVDLSFRKNEFVAVLGPSGCGKTTMLNLIGGLDKYTSGDLFINGTSTKEYKDHDWDVYRNRRIGFIFQSYNLIPHQTVLGNVELSLTIAGLTKQERIERSKKALDTVGLSDQYYKKPNQLSGGQSQRVAIARALVNEPEILLADEPTGALDSVTSVQIMDLVKEIARERLVIMVTHNQDLAENYATRIVTLLDGELQSDSNPFTEKAEMKEVQLLNKDVPAPSKKVKQRAKMSLFTAFMLSLKNLLSKKGRTIMTGIAGSIGIIGVSLVLAISAGVRGFIGNMQDDMLSGNPITISEQSYDLNALMAMTTMTEMVKEAAADGFVNVDSAIKTIVDRFNASESIMVRNDITQEYVDYVSNMPKEYYASISFGYGLDVTNNIYTDFTHEPDEFTGISTTRMSISTLKNVYTSILNQTQFGKYSEFIATLSDIFAQAPSDTDYILSQYDMLTGKIAKEKNEIMIVVNGNVEITDLVLGQLGYLSQDEFLNMAYLAGGEDSAHLHNPNLDKPSFSYEELLGKKFYYFSNDTVYNKEVSSYSPFSYNPYSASFSDSGLELSVVGILKPKESISYGSLESGFYYTDAFTKHFLAENKNSEISTYIDTLVDTDTGEKTPIIYSGMYSMGSLPPQPVGIHYDYSFTYEGHTETEKGFIGTSSGMGALIGSLGLPLQVGDMKSLTLRNVGGASLPSRISVYPTNFDYKDDVTTYLDGWNDISDNKITYTDTLGMIIRIINNLIDIISVALISFTAVSLLVSTVMIGIITYVSVVERVKEIGVIRSLGGRKRDVSNLFIAETAIIGFVAGAIGIAVTYLLQIGLNLIIGHATGVKGMDQIAALPWYQALIMIGISVGLTLISGVAPARAAAKKDPVVALRTE